ncbi:hypothetical protein NDU88_006020 [Pleurodeles waltl]|nr:hypothetical protein NDU88_006020 [Pleurodeles waltl]
MLRCSSDKVRQVIILAKRVEHTLACVEELEKGRSLAINKIAVRKENPKKEGDGEKGEEKVIMQEQWGKVCGSLRSERNAVHGTDVITDVRSECWCERILRVEKTD